MVLIDADKVQFVAGKIECKSCKQKTAGVWPDGLCITCFIETLREKEYGQQKQQQQEQQPKPTPSTD